MTTTPAKLTTTPAESMITPGMEALRQMATPLTTDELAALRAKLESGWNPLAGRPKGPRPRLSPLDDDESTRDWSLADDIFSWIDETLSKYLNRLPRALCDVAIQKFIQTPCSSDELLAFLHTFAEAYERALYKRIEQQTPPLTAAKQTTTTSLGLACQARGVVKLRLERLVELSKKQPQHAEIFRLSEFAGCNPRELAGYLGMTEAEADRQIKYRRLAVCGTYDTI